MPNRTIMHSTGKTIDIGDSHSPSAQAARDHAATPMGAATLRPSLRPGTGYDRFDTAHGPTPPDPTSRGPHSGPGSPACALTPAEIGAGTPSASSLASVPQPGDPRFFGRLLHRQGLDGQRAGTDTATAGPWERGDPVATNYAGTAVQHGDYATESTCLSWFPRAASPDVVPARNHPPPVDHEPSDTTRDRHPMPSPVSRPTTGVRACRTRAPVTPSAQRAPSTCRVPSPHLGPR